MNFICMEKLKKYQNQIHVMISTLVSRLALCCAVFHVMNFIGIGKPKKYQNQIHVMISTLVSRLALCCTVLHVMIHVMVLIPETDWKS